jgi:hypothetical protein
MQVDPLSIPLGILSGITLILLTLLIGLHAKISSQNITTNELYKETYKGFLVHPLSMGGFFKNIKVSLCRKNVRAILEPRNNAYIGDILSS